MRRTAFTLIELLVTITIIAVLSGLILGGVSAVRRAVATAEGTRRITEIQTALQAYGAGTGSGLEQFLGQLRATLLTGTLGQPATAFPGVVRFRTDTRVGRVEPEANEAWPATRPTWMLAHPWGRPATDFLTDPDGFNPPQRLPRPNEESLLTPDVFGISDMTPAFSAELLMLAGVLPLDGTTAASIDAARTRYRTDRSPKASWNDGWGNPLVVGFAWYHPRLNPSVNGIANAHKNLAGLDGNLTPHFNIQANRPDLFIQRANESYSYFRAGYVAVAALGKNLPSTVTASEITSAAADWTSATGVQQRVWQAADSACNRNGAAELWRSGPGIDLSGRPPWTGVKPVRTAGTTRMLSAPVEIR